MTVMKDRSNTEIVREIKANERPSSDAERPLRQIRLPKIEGIDKSAGYDAERELTSGV